MIVELGHFALILAFAVALFQMVVPMVGAARGLTGWMGVAVPAAHLQFGLTALSFGALTYAFVTSDFSVQLVVDNSHTLKPMIYKITGVWGNHEGSLLLWVLILTLFGAAAAYYGTNLPPRLKARVLAVQSSVAVAFFAFILFTSNPFLRTSAPPFDGRDLNPLLQDPGLVLHPPFLYLGYVGLSMAFSFAVAALLEGRVDAAWGRWVRPWTLAAWIFLTIGIAIGSWWAYYELGWGGFWFWDPVENASFMPWLIAAALLHSAIVVEKREALKAWTILLAILAFGFSLIGTFIVRSGVLTSVHAFANDPERGVYILGMIGFFLVVPLALFAWRGPAMVSQGVFSTVSRESALIFNNLILAVSCAIVFIGTIWPLVAELFFDRTLSVGPPFFNASFNPFVIAAALALPIGAMLPWKRGRFEKLWRPLVPAAILGVAVLLLSYAVSTGESAMGPIMLGLGAWLVAGAASDLWQRTGRGEFAGRLSRLTRLPRADWGKSISHAGVGVAILGVAGLVTFQTEDIRVAQVGEAYQVGRYTIVLQGVDPVEGPNYVSRMARIEVRQGGVLIATLTPERRFYPVAGMPTTEAAIASNVMRDLYAVIGDPQEAGGWVVRFWIKPFANWMWAGAGLMALGGLMSLTDRRYRVAAGAPRASKPSAKAARPTRDGVPAE
ncbi:MAG: heme lyase CcmF/NrfE family subunit [Pseudomonadota bacterium]